MSELREDLIVSAVAFLKDEKVASAPMNKKIEFLKDKDLTQDEIQEALRRADSGNVGSVAESSTGTTTTSTRNDQTVNRPAPVSPAAPPPLPAYSHLAYTPPVPKRDWKDYFIMATTSVGITYGLYQIAKRYVLPSILPPPPAALESDKQALDEEFAKAQEVLDQLQRDHAELKENEQERARKIDDLVREVDSALHMVKNQVHKRDEDMKLVKAQIELVKKSLPESLAEHNSTQQEALKEVLDELTDLKQLVSSRLNGGGSTTPVSTNPPKPYGVSSQTGPSTTPPSLPGTSGSQAASGSGMNGVGGSSSSNSAVASPAPQPQIPAWQLAAASSSSNSS